MAINGGQVSSSYFVWPQDTSKQHFTGGEADWLPQPGDSRIPLTSCSVRGILIQFFSAQSSCQMKILKCRGMGGLRRTSSAAPWCHIEDNG